MNNTCYHFVLLYYILFSIVYILNDEDITDNLEWIPHRNNVTFVVNLKFIYFRSIVLCACMASLPKLYAQRMPNEIYIPIYCVTKNNLFITNN